MEIRSRFVCPICDRGILNRKINKCLYCGAALPSELLFSSEKIAAMDAQMRADEEERARNRKVGPGTSDLGTGGGLDVVDVVNGIDLLSDIAGLFD
ncbi:MAG: hypothetical protein ACJ8GW_05280 [Massilia sp.]